MPIIVNKQLELDKTIQYRLSIQVDLNGFSFSIVNDEQKKCHFLFQSNFADTEDSDIYNAAIFKMVKSSPLLSKKFSSTDVIINTHKFTAIPVSNFKEEDAGLILRDLHSLEEIDEVDIIIEEKQEMVLLFAVNSTFLNIIKTVQPNFKVAPSIYQMINNSSLFTDTQKLFVQYHKGHVHIVITNGTKVIFCNSFPALQFSTVLYFMILALKQSEIKQEETTVILSGNFTEEDLITLPKYFREIKYFRDPSISLGKAEIEMKYAPMMFPI